MPDDCDIGGESKDPVVCGDVVIVPVLKNYRPLQSSVWKLFPTPADNVHARCLIKIFQLSTPARNPDIMTSTLLPYPSFPPTQLFLFPNFSSPFFIILIESSTSSLSTLI